MESSVSLFKRLQVKRLNAKIYNAIEKRHLLFCNIKPSTPTLFITYHYWFQDIVEMSIELLKTGKPQGSIKGGVPVNVMLFHNIADTIIKRKCLNFSVILYYIMGTINWLIIKSRIGVNILREKLWKFSLVFLGILET